MIYANSFYKRLIRMELHVVFHMPKFPVILIRCDALFCAGFPQSLVDIIAIEIQNALNNRFWNYET